MKGIVGLLGWAFLAGVVATLFATELIPFLIRHLSVVWR